MEKVFPYRYNDEINKRIFNKVEECFEKRTLNINEIYDAFIAHNMNIIGFDAMEWPDFFQDLKDENKKNMVYDYKKRNIEQFNMEVCIQDQYMPSNYYLDEISVYSICMRLNHNLFNFSVSKLDQYEKDLKIYHSRHKKAIKYEKDNNFDNRGYPTKK